MTLRERMEHLVKRLHADAAYLQTVADDFAEPDVWSERMHFTEISRTTERIACALDLELAKE